MKVKNTGKARSSSNDRILAELEVLRRRHPIAGRLLPPFLTSGGSHFAFVKCDESDKKLAHLAIHPGPSIRDQFRISLEIPIVLSLHEVLEPRVLNDFEKLRQRPTTDQDIGVLVARDPTAKTMVLDRREHSYPILVILDTELESVGSASSLHSELQKLLRSANYFEFSKDIRSRDQFFGRLSDITTIINLIKSGQSVGVFGLRKSGKTSLLHQARRALAQINILAPQVQLNRVESASDFREKIVTSVAAAVLESEGEIPGNLVICDHSGSVRPSVADAIVNRRWTADLIKLARATRKSICIVIDEIDLANDESARESDDNSLVEFDRAERRSLNKVLRELRGAIQDVEAGDTESKMAVLAAGVAASITTSSVRFGQDNQLFQFLTPYSLGPMPREDIQMMVRTLGKRSGLDFQSETLLDTLHRECGGHPFLTRLACSLIADRRETRQDADVPYHVTHDDLASSLQSRGERSPYHVATQTLRSFGLWYPEEYAAMQSVLPPNVPGPLSIADIPHAVDFGLFGADGRVCMGILLQGEDGCDDKQ